MTEPVLLILLSLAESPRHGYALLKDIDAMSFGRVRLSTGTLYGALHRLLENDWIEPFEGADTSRDKKRSYRLTAQGRRVLGLGIRSAKATDANCRCPFARPRGMTAYEAYLCRSD